MGLGLGEFFVFSGWEGDGNKGGGLVPLVRGRQKNTMLENLRVRRGEHSASPAAREGGRWV